MGRAKQQQQSLALNYIVPQESEMDTKSIKKRLIDLSLSQTQIAAEIGCSIQAVCMFINGRIESKRIRDYLEIRLGFRQVKGKKAAQ